MNDGLTWEQRRGKLRNAEFKEAAAMRRAAGAHITQGRVDPVEVMMRLAEIPEEDRDLTGQLMGDPPRHDPRRTWAPHLAGGR